MTISKLNFYLIWGTTGVIIFIIEFLLASHFNLLYSVSYGMLWAVTFVGWFMLPSITINRSKQEKYIEIALRLHAIIDYSLSKKYTAITERLTHANLEIFKFPRLTGMYQSPSFTPLGKKPEIFINEGFFYKLNDNEIEAIILHEIHHFIKKDGFKRYFLDLAILSFAGFSLLALIALLLTGLHLFLIIFTIVIVSGLLITIFMLKINLIYSEISADTFAAKTMKTNIYVISSLKKSFETAEQYYPDKKKRLQRIYQRRIISLEKTYLNRTDKSNTPE